jgi:hypothetical protein
MRLKRLKTTFSASTLSYQKLQIKFQREKFFNIFAKNQAYGWAYSKVDIGG